MDPQQAQQQAMHIMAAIVPFIAVIFLFIAVINIIPLWRICTKAGLPGPLSLLAIIGLGKLILLYVLAFSDWKVVPVATASPYLPPVYPPPPAFQPPPQV